MSRILIAYITKTGTTLEIALEIQKTLIQNSFEVDIKPIDQIQTVNGYSGIIVGAPINGMKWMPAAKGFIADHQSTLMHIPTAIWAVSYMAPTGYAFWRKAIQNDMNKIKVSINAGMVGVFGGKITAKLPLIARWVFGSPKNAPLDLRDWATIQAWTNDLVLYFDQNNSDNRL